MRTGALLIVVLSTAVVAASCSTGDSAVPGIEGSPDLEPAQSLVEALPETTAPVTEPAVTEPAPTTPLTTTVGTTTSPTTAAPTDGCASLTSDGYDTRKDTIAGLSDAELRLTEANCADAVARLRAAVEIEQRMAAFNADPEPLGAADLVCSGGSFSVTVTNNVDHPIGVHASLRLVADGVEGPLGSTLQPLFIWTIEPGASAELTDDFEVNRPTDAALECEVDITAFDATPGDADASLGETTVPELTGDDPAQWLPFLVAQGAAIIGSGDADLAAVVEDVRSTEFPRVVSLTEAATDGPVESGTISVCTAGVEQPDDRHISIVYFDEGTDESELQHGLFRRGNDGQWRWLGSSVYFDSREYWDCGTPSINL